MIRILVTGSRHQQDQTPVRQAIFEWLLYRYRGELARGPFDRAAELSYSGPDQVLLVHGGARGVDALAAEVAREHEWKVESYPAEDFGSWPGCGPRRNAHMVSLGADVCLAFPGPNSRGTWDCVRKAQAAGIPVRIRAVPL